MKLVAAIFDLNGTVLDDEEVYEKSFSEVLKNLGVTIDPSFKHTLGIGVKENWVLYQSKYKFKTEKTYEELALETQKVYLQNISSVSVRSGFDEFINTLKENNIRVALATSNTWEMTDKILETFNLTDVFEIVTTGEEVVNNKPNPEIFNVTADKLGVEREDCLVIEDSEAGVLAAKEAGMRVVAISENENIQDLMDKADKVVEGFSDIKLKEIMLLF